MEYVCPECGIVYGEKQAEDVNMSCCGQPLEEFEAELDEDYDELDDYEEDDYEENSDYDDSGYMSDYDLREAERERDRRITEGRPMKSPGCSCAIETDEYHGWECTVTGGACMYIFPSSKACAKEWGEGPDAYDEDGDLITEKDDESDHDYPPQEDYN